jgi:hypothetical protein
VKGIRRAAVLGAVALAAAAAAVAPSAAAAPVTARAAAAGCPPWNGVQPVKYGSDVVAVAMSSACSAWAVGGVVGTGGTEISEPFVLHWNGPTWTQQAAPVYPNQVSGLSAVAATSSRNAWAVGYGPAPGVTGGTFQALILRWDGSTWTRQPAPQPSGPLVNELTGVTATSARDAWAVGYYFNGAHTQTLILHWSGRAWTRVPSPDPGGRTRFNTLTAVTANSATNAWAVGYSLAPHAPPTSTAAFVLHWNGRSWARTPIPDQSVPVELTSVTATSPRNAWAVGYDQLAGGVEDTVILHWNGRAWKRQPSPNRSKGSNPLPPDDVLEGVAATSARDAWAVGDYRDASGGFSCLILHWNGRAWRWLLTPSGDNLISVAAASPRSAWAVGPGTVMHWNGTTWQL